MTKRPLKRLVREGAFDDREFQEDAKVRRLPTARAAGREGRTPRIAKRV